MASNPPAVAAASSAAAPVSGPQPNLAALARNAQAVGWARTLASVASASAAGVAGVQGLVPGVACYVAGHAALQTLLLVLRMRGGPPTDYLISPGTPAPLPLPGSRLSAASALSWVVLDGVGDNALFFLVIWALAFSVVHFF